MKDILQGQQLSFKIHKIHTIPFHVADFISCWRLPTTLKLESTSVQFFLIKCFKFQGPRFPHKKETFPKCGGGCISFCCMWSITRCAIKAPPISYHTQTARVFPYCIGGRFMHDKSIFEGISPNAHFPFWTSKSGALFGPLLRWKFQQYLEFHESRGFLWEHWVCLIGSGIMCCEIVCG